MGYNNGKWNIKPISYTYKSLKLIWLTTAKQEGAIFSEFWSFFNFPFTSLLVYQRGNKGRWNQFEFMLENCSELGILWVFDKKHFSETKACGRSAGYAHRYIDYSDKISKIRGPRYNKFVLYMTGLKYHTYLLEMNPEEPSLCTSLTLDCALDVAVLSTAERTHAHPRTHAHTHTHTHTQNNTLISIPAYIQIEHRPLYSQIPI